MSNIVLAQEKDHINRIRELLEYFPLTGIIMWRETGKGRRIDRIAGCTDRHGYLQTRIDGKIYFNHRIAWAYVYGEMPSGVIDHINGDPSDNRIENLRDVTRKTNQENQRRAAASNTTSGLLGVSLHRNTGKFVASIQADRKSYYLGLYETPERAHEVYIAAKRKLHKGTTI